MRRPYATEVLGGLGISLTGAALALEYWHVWRKGRAPLPTETEDVLEAGAEAARETVEVVVAGYQAGSRRENAALNLLVSYALTAATVRAGTHLIRIRGPWGPLRNRHVAGRHIHHFLPGIGLVLLSGTASIVSRGEQYDRLLAVPFGAGGALILDEAALLVELEDVYWSKEGVLSVQVTTATLSILGALALGRRVARRGEAEVLLG